jgi:polysaccharide export outer membrane protein
MRENTARTRSGKGQGVARWLIGTLALSALFMQSAVQAQPPPPASANGVAPRTFPPQDPTDQYIIGPGDSLQVFVWRNPDLSQTVPVRPDGRISTPLVQNMVAVGKTPAQLAHDMERVLSQYIRSPQVNIIVTQPVGELSQVKIIGQVAHPEAIPYHKGMTVLDVVLQAGGLTLYAAGNRAKLVRMEHGHTEEMPVRLKNLVEKGDLSQNLAVQPGDVLVVPEARF